MLDHRLEAEMFAGQSLHSAEMCSTRRIYEAAAWKTFPPISQDGRTGALCVWLGKPSHTHTRAGTHLQNPSDTAEGK